MYYKERLRQDKTNPTTPFPTNGSLALASQFQGRGHINVQEDLIAVMGQPRRLCGDETRPVIIRVITSVVNTYKCNHCNARKKCNCIFYNMNEMNMNYEQ